MFTIQTPTSNLIRPDVEDEFIEVSDEPILIQPNPAETIPFAIKSLTESILNIHKTLGFILWTLIVLVAVMYFNAH